jgi:hypothetical protein
MSAAGVSLDKAISGIARGIENATRTLKDINPDGVKQANGNKSVSGTEANRTVGNTIDVTV